jgi:CRP-like cAMP-binding protein
MQDAADWRIFLPDLARGATSLTRTLDAEVYRAVLRSGSILFKPGVQPHDLFLIVRGTVRLSAVTPAGRSILLGTWRAGQGHALVGACMMFAPHQKTVGVAASDIDVIGLPGTVFQRLMNTSKAFRGAIFAALCAQMARLVDDAVASGVAPRPTGTFGVPRLQS